MRHQRRCRGAHPRVPRSARRPASCPGQAGALRPVVRARGLRRGLRRRHQGPQVPPDPRAGDPGAAQPRSPGRVRLRGQYRRRRGRADPDAARLFPARRQQGPAVLASRARGVRQRARLPAAQPDAAAAPGREHFEHIVQSEGQTLLGWRTVPANNSSLGETARAGEPFIRQVFIGRGPGVRDEAEFERKLYVIRKRAYSEIRTSTIDGAEYWYLCSLSHKTFVYKGMLLTEQLTKYFTDLEHPAMETALALVHSRFSTNTFPSWDRAHPYRYLAHNGEINTLRGNYQLDAGARGAVRLRALRRGHRRRSCRSSTRTAATRRCSTTRSSCWCSRAARCRTP